MHAFVHLSYVNILRKELNAEAGEMKKTFIPGHFSSKLISICFIYLLVFRAKQQELMSRAVRDKLPANEVSSDQLSLR